ncbi:MAG: polymer-forming cytoskeletal protein [bacterium]|nr:polymer-forming cytoskeletal protein [bacterium]
MSQPTPAAPAAQPRGDHEGPLEAIPVIIEAGASFEGQLACRHASRIDGCLRGDVVASERIELGEGADVKGRIEARDIIVAGTFEGELVAQHSIELLATARVRGELFARELAAEEGCAVTGRCHAGPAPNPAGTATRRAP